MALDTLTTLPLNWTPSSASHVNDYVEGRVDWFGNGSGGRKVDYVTVTTSGASDMTTNSDGQGFGVTGNATKDYWGDGMIANRNGQKDGRVVVNIGHNYTSSGSVRYLSSSTQSCHLRNAVGLSMVYNNNVASEQKYAANLQRIALLYAMPDEYSSGKHQAWVYEASLKLPGSQSLRSNLSNGDKIYAYALSNTDQSIITANKMTLEGAYLEFSVNQSPGCCKSKDCAARVWRLTPLITNQHSTSIGNGAPSWLTIPSKNTISISSANASGLKELSKG